MRRVGFAASGAHRGPAGCLMLLALCIAAPGRAQAPAGGDPRAGAKLISQFGCGMCHSIPGIANANGRVGPPLDNIGVRTFIAGLLPNTPANMVRWLRSPQSITPGNAMPDMGLDEHEAQDIAAYLSALR